MWCVCVVLVTTAWVMRVQNLDYVVWTLGANLEFRLLVSALSRVLFIVMQLRLCMLQLVRCVLSRTSIGLSLRGWLSSRMLVVTTVTRCEFRRCRLLWNSVCRLGRCLNRWMQKVRVVRLVIGVIRVKSVRMTWTALGATDGLPVRTAGSVMAVVACCVGGVGVVGGV